MSSDIPNNLRYISNEVSCFITETKSDITLYSKRHEELETQLYSKVQELLSSKKSLKTKCENVAQATTTL